MTVSTSLIYLILTVNMGSVCILSSWFWVIILLLVKYADNLIILIFDISMFIIKIFIDQALFYKNLIITIDQLLKHMLI